MTIRCLPRWPALLLLGAFAVYAAPMHAAETAAEKRTAESEPVHAGQVHGTLDGCAERSRRGGG